MGLISSIPIEVLIEREYGNPCVVLTMPDGKSEEFEPDECREWFRLRNANSDAVEQALDEVWNFGKASVLISRPRILAKLIDRLDPKI
jgi:hypothetical protein